MPFNKSKACVRRQQRYLEDMLNAQRTLTWPVKDSKKFAYKLREARWAASQHPEFARFHSLMDDYKIRVKPGYVEAEYVGTSDKYISPIFAPESMTIEEVTDVQGVVGATIKFAVRCNELRFPNAVLTSGECKALYDWGRGQKGYTWKLIVHSDAGCTMTRKDVDDIFLWEPEENDDGPAVD